MEKYVNPKVSIFKHTCNFSIVSFHWNVIMNNRFIVLVLFLALFSGSLARPKASKGPKDPELSSNDQEKDDERRASKEPKDPKLNSNDEEDVERRASKEPKDPELNSNDEEENVERRGVEHAIHKCALGFLEWCSKEEAIHNPTLGAGSVSF